MFKRIFLLKNTDVMTNFGNIFFYVPKLFIHSYDRRFGERGNSDIETTTKWSRDLRRRSIRRNIWLSVYLWVRGELLVAFFSERASGAR